MALPSRIVSFLALGAFSVISACGSFGSTGKGEEPDGGQADAAATTDAAITAPIRCAETMCAATTKCCLPLEGGQPSCVERNAGCPNGFGELRCSSAAGCATGEVCCLNAKRDSGQQGFGIAQAFCVTASKCPDGDLQHSLCDLGDRTQCSGGKACLGYLEDTEGTETKKVNTTGYGTCQ